MGTIIDTTADVVHDVDRTKFLPGQATVLRRDSYYMEAHAGRAHPVIIDALKRFDRRDTGAYINWPMLDQFFTSGKGDLFRISEVYRTPERQAELYAQGRADARSIVTKVQPYKSYHQWGLAFDLVLTRYGYEAVTVNGKYYDFNTRTGWLALGVPQFFESLGLTWGGRWSGLVDAGHYEYGVEVPRDDSFCGSPWWSMGADLVALGSRPAGGLGQSWVVAGMIAAGVWILKKRKA